MSLAQKRQVFMMMTVIMTSCWARHGAPREWRLVLAAYRFHLWQHVTTKKKTPVEALNIIRQFRSKCCLFWFKVRMCETLEHERRSASSLPRILCMVGPPAPNVSRDGQRSLTGLAARGGCLYQQRETATAHFAASIPMNNRLCIHRARTVLLERK